MISWCFDFVEKTDTFRYSNNDNLTDLTQKRDFELFHN